jgi:ubiquinone/menaquinone biosynthesis C-methylase UbiE
VSLTQELLENQEERGDRVALGDGEKMPYEDQTFDYIFSFSVLEHVNDIEAVLKECYRVLKTDGVLYLSVPNYMKFREPHFKMFYIPLLPKRIGAKYFDFMGRKGRFIHTLHFTTPKKIVKAIESSGFILHSNPIKTFEKRFIEKIENTSQEKGVRKLLFRLIKYSLVGKNLVLCLINRGFFVSNHYIARK